MLLKGLWLAIIQIPGNLPPPFRRRLRQVLGEGGTAMNQRDKISVLKEFTLYRCAGNLQDKEYVRRKSCDVKVGW